MKLSFTELREILATYAELEVRRQQVRQLLTESIALRQQIIDLLAGDAATQAKAAELFAKSEATEARMRAGLPTTP